MRGQDAYARAVLGSIAGRDQLKRRVAELSGGTAVAYGVQSAGGNIFYQVRPAGADNFKLAVRKGVGGAERILLDPTTMKSDDGKHVSLDWWRASPDGKHVVYGLSPAGSENSVLHVMEVESMRVLPERIAGTQYASPSWLPDGSGFFYWRVADAAKIGTAAYYLNSPSLLHRLGTDPKDDVLMMVRGKDSAVAIDEKEFPYIGAGRSGEYAVLGVFGGVRRQNPLYVAQAGRRGCRQGRMETGLHDRRRGRRLRLRRQGHVFADHARCPQRQGAAHAAGASSLQGRCAGGARGRAGGRGAGAGARRPVPAGSRRWLPQRAQAGSRRQAGAGRIAVGRLDRRPVGQHRRRRPVARRHRLAAALLDLPSRPGQRQDATRRPGAAERRSTSTPTRPCEPSPWPATAPRCRCRSSPGRA